jgi:hypothetical protein
MLNRFTRRILAFVLAFMMTVTLTPAAFAETVDPDNTAGAEVVKEEDKEEEVAFCEEAIVDGFIIKVTADKGVFPKGARLVARLASSSEEQDALEAVDEIGGSENAEIAYFFDISIVDADGNEIQPDNSKGTTTISFTASEVADYDIAVYNIHNGELNAIDFEEEDTTATAVADGFCTWMIFGWGYGCPKPTPCPTPTPTPCPTPTPTPTPDPTPCPEYEATVAIDGWTYGDGDAPNTPIPFTTVPKSLIKSDEIVYYDTLDPLVVHEGEFTSTTPAGDYYVQYKVKYCSGTVCSDPVKFTIKKKDITLTVKDQGPIYVGDPAPESAEVVYDGLLDVDMDGDKPKAGVLDDSALTFTYKDKDGKAYEAGSPAGEYIIEAVGEVTAANYNLVLRNPGTLTVLDPEPGPGPEPGPTPPGPEPTPPSPTPDPTPITPTEEVTPVVIAKVEVKGNNLKLSWEEVKGAECFDIYMSKCNHNKKIFKLKKFKTVSGKVRSVTIKGINKKLIYKFRVVAKKKKGNGKWKVIGKSRVLHIVPSKKNKKFTNQKSLKLKKPKSGKLTLKVGKTYKIKATYKKEQKSKKYLDRGHAARLRYISSNKKVATVTKKGVIKAKKSGKCKIYTQLINGKWKAVELTVEVVE